MNVQYLEENNELLSHSGLKLTDMEAALVENSLVILQSNNKLRDIFFMGRIETSGADRYYIAFGYSKDVLEDRKFFYSLNGYEWVMMPDLKPKLMPVALKSKNCFRGDPAYVEEVCMVRTVANLIEQSLISNLLRIRSSSLTMTKFSPHVHQR